MSVLLNENLKYLKSLKQQSPSKRKHLLTNPPKNLVCCICEICQNILSGNIPLKLSSKKRLSRFKHLVRFLAKPKANINKKKKLLIQKGGGTFLPLLLGPLLSIAPHLLKQFSDQ